MKYTVTRWRCGDLAGIIHLSDIYYFEGYTFEWHHYGGASLCRRDMEPSARQPGARSRFWVVLAKWEKLPKEKKEATRIYG